MVGILPMYPSWYASRVYTGCAQPPPVYLLYSCSVHEGRSGPSCSSLAGVEHRRVWQEERRPPSPQNKPLSPEETAQKRRRNLLQKAVLYKETNNLSTPPGMTPNPPQGPEPLFHSGILLSDHRENRRGWSISRQKSAIPGYVNPDAKSAPFITRFSKRSIISKR